MKNQTRVHYRTSRMFEQKPLMLRVAWSRMEPGAMRPFPMEPYGSCRMTFFFLPTPGHQTDPHGRPTVVILLELIFS